jgi:uncharacterized protein YqjF (DUF2071 family)
MNFDHASRSYPISSRPFAMRMSWLDLLFMHWPVDVALLRPHVPARLSIDVFGGSAWIGVVPFRMHATRARFLPAVPFLSSFPELNVRTYVTIDGKPGVWFFSLDACNRVAVEVARRTFHLNYCHAKMSSERTADEIRYASRRTHKGMPAATFDGRYRATDASAHSTPDSLEHFLTERYCLYADRKGTLLRGEIAHEPWPLCPAEAEVRLNTMTEQLGFPLPDTKPLLHFADRLDVIAWLPEIVDS